MENDKQKPFIPVYLKLNAIAALHLKNDRKKSKTESNIDLNEFLTIDKQTQKATTHPPTNSRYKTTETFDFNKVFDTNSSHEDVFKNTMLPLVEQVVQMKNDSLYFTMGTTGSGKSFTIFGSNDSREKYQGIIPLSVYTIFNSIENNLLPNDHTKEKDFLNLLSLPRSYSNITANMLINENSIEKPKNEFKPNFKVQLNENGTDESNTKYAVFISLLEIYNDRIFDLFSEASSNYPINTSSRTTRRINYPSNSHRKTLVIKSDTKSGRTYVPELSKIYVKSAEQALQILNKGLSHRTVQPTGTNTKSSRSHAIFSIELIKVSNIPNNKKPNALRTLAEVLADEDTFKIESCILNIADLAGSERTRLAQTSGERLAEGSSINKSLMLVGQALQKQRELQTNSSANNTSHGKNNTDGKSHSISSVSSNNLDLNFRSCKLTHLLFSNIFAGRLFPNSVALLITIDPDGDYNSSTQILRYAALARQVEMPSSSSSSSSLLPRINTLNSSSVSASAKKQIMALHREIESYKCKLTVAEARIYSIEEEVREELCSKMDNVLDRACKDYNNTASSVADSEQTLLDDKLQIIIEELSHTNSLLEAEKKKNLKLSSELKQAKEEIKIYKQQQTQLLLQVRQNNITHEKTKTEHDENKSPLKEIQNQLEFSDTYNKKIIKKKSRTNSTSSPLRDKSRNSNKSDKHNKISGTDFLTQQFSTLTVSPSGSPKKTMRTLRTTLSVFDSDSETSY